MTTGRINQVTILYAGRAPEPCGSGAKTSRLDPPKGTEVSYTLGWDGQLAESRLTARSVTASPPWGGRPSFGVRSSNCPHWVPQGVVRHNDSFGPRKDDHEAATCTPQEEDTTLPVTSTRDGYRPRLTPGNL